MSKIILVSNPKGGCGKTTTAVNLSTALTILDHKTLLIDMDPAGACAATLGFSKQKIKGDIFDLLSFKKSLAQVIHQTELKNLDFIPSNISTQEIEEKLERFTYNIFLFKNLLNNVTDKYNYIIIDCPPNLRGMTTIALAAANSIIIPVMCGYLSLLALRKMLAYVSWIRRKWNHNLKIEGILISMFEANTKASALTEEKLYHGLGKYVFKTMIPKNTSIAESTYYGKPVLLYNIKSNGSIAFLNLANEIRVKNKICPVIRALKQYKYSDIDLHHRISV